MVEVERKRRGGISFLLGGRSSRRRKGRGRGRDRGRRRRRQLAPDPGSLQARR